MARRLLHLGAIIVATLAALAVAAVAGVWLWFQAASGQRLPRVMMAKTLLVATGERAAFKATLESVLAAPRDVMPRARLANEIARRRAARYLEGMNEMFPRTKGRATAGRRDTARPRR